MQNTGAPVALIVALSSDARRGERWAALSAPFMRPLLVNGVAEAAALMDRETVDALLVDAGTAGNELEPSLRRLAAIVEGRPTVVILPAEKTGARGIEELAAELAIASVVDGGAAEACRVLRHLVAQCRQQEPGRSDRGFETGAGLVGRAAFGHEVASRLGMTWAPSAVVVIDVDKLGAVNELVGRELADRALMCLGERLTGAIREDEVLSVAGGGRYLLWMQVGMLAEAAPLRVRQLLDVVCRPLQLDSQRLQLTATAGIAFHPVDAAGVETLVARAEAAMYRAKASGPNSYRLHQPALIGAAPALLKKQTAVRREIDRDNLELVFEPQLDLRTERPRAAGLGLRMRAEGVLVQPCAEELDDLALPVMRWTLEAAGAQMAGWLAREVPLVPLVIDLPLQLVRRSDVVEMVRRRLLSAGCHPAWFEVAVRAEHESAQIIDATTADHLQALRDLGLRVILAGCGGRHSTFGMLRHIPADAIELASDLVEGRRQRASDATILAALVDLALALGLEVGANGVNRHGLARELKALGCDWVSGTWVGAAMPAAAFSEWLSGGEPLMSIAS